MKRKVLSAVLIISAFVLASCGQDGATSVTVPTEITMSEATNTPASTNTSVPTNTPAPTNTPVPTSTPAPTNTPVPTNTPAPTNTPVPTNTPAPTNTPVPTNTPTPMAAAYKMLQTSTYYEVESYTESRVSSDHNLQEETVIYDPNNGYYSDPKQERKESLTISLDGNVVKEISTVFVGVEGNGKLECSDIYDDCFAIRDGLKITLYTVEGNDIKEIKSVNLPECCGEEQGSHYQIVTSPMNGWMSVASHYYYGDWEDYLIIDFNTGKVVSFNYTIENKWKELGYWDIYDVFPARAWEAEDLINNGCWVREKNKKCNLFKLDEKENPYLADTFDWIDFRGKYWAAGKGDICGFLNADCEFVKNYDDASAFLNGYALVVEDGQAYLINEEFEKVELIGEADSVVAYQNGWACISKDKTEMYFALKEE